MNFLVYLGMCDYLELEDVCKVLVEKFVDLFVCNWAVYGFVCENYFLIDGICIEFEFRSFFWYIWGGLLVLMGLMEEGYYD